MAKFFVTTPIYYVNDAPHVGHAYTTILADAFARFHRMKGDDVFFLTGLDENSVKTVQAAKAKGMPIREYTDAMAKIWRNSWEKLGISNNDFIRTTEERHAENVKNFFMKVFEKGDIYRGTYTGLYCDGCEAFLKESELKNGLCPLHNKPPRKLSEENYFFKLSKYADRILEHIKKNPSFILPESRRNEVVSFIKQGLEDISVSRPRTDWGIRLPIDDAQVVWVWFDALINYLAPKGQWPAELHLMAKDIIKFHCIIWPGMLLSAGYALPKTVFAHGYFTIGGMKISKSLGNKIDPLHLAEKYSVDSLRYFLLAEIPLGGDGDFSEEALKNRNNNELAANYGNLFYRVTSFIEKNFGGMVPEGKADRGMEKKLKEAAEEYEKLFNSYKLHDAIKSVMALSTEANKYFQEREPWKNPEKSGDALYNATNLLKGISLLFYPFAPNSCAKALEALGEKEILFKDENKFTVKPGTRVTPVILFKKVD